MTEESPEEVRVIVCGNETVFAFVIVNVPVEEVIVSPLIEVAVAAPKAGAIKVGPLLKTANPPPPLPVSSESTPANCAEVVAANTERLSENSATVSAVFELFFTFQR